MSSDHGLGRQEEDLAALRRLSSGDEQDGVRRPWRRIWDEIRDPVGAERPGEAEARIVRIVSAYDQERRRERSFRWAGLSAGWRWASAAAPVVGLLLGLWTSSVLAPMLGVDQELAPTPETESLLEEAWMAAAPASLAELYLDDLEIDVAEPGEHEGDFEVAR